MREKQQQQQQKRVDGVANFLRNRTVIKLAHYVAQYQFAPLSEWLALQSRTPPLADFNSPI